MKITLNYKRGKGKIVIINDWITSTWCWWVWSSVATVCIDDMWWLITSTPLYLILFSSSSFGLIGWYSVTSYSRYPLWYYWPTLTSYQCNTTTISKSPLANFNLFMFWVIFPPTYEVTMVKIWYTINNLFTY